MKIKKVDHIGIVVRSLDEVIPFYRDHLGLPLSRIEAVPAQAVRIAFLPVGESEVELLEPTDPDGSVAGYLEKRGESMHHICFEVEDIEGALAELKAQGVRLIDEQPKVGSHGQKMAFIHPKSTHGVLIELYERS
jgi:methylmalonyl-CoA/ethylmalonyl-CoA epimerase